MYRPLQYLLAKWRNPARADFLSMGAGIEARAARCRDYWRPHLECTKEFQRIALNGEEFYSAAVLGAGSLLDIDLQLLQRAFRTISLWDANPTLTRHWKRFAARLNVDQLVSFHHADLTGCLDDWAAQLDEFLLANKPHLPLAAEFIADLCCALPEQSWSESEVVYSINLLSQIPLYWRDRVHHLFDKRWNVETDENGRFEIDLQSALDDSMRKLQQQHIELLARSAAQRLILISDKRFMYYVSHIANWQIVPALFIEEPFEIRGFERSGRSQWYWHIAPQGVEQQEYGIIHDVRAASYERSVPARAEMLLPKLRAR